MPKPRKLLRKTGYSVLGIFLLLNIIAITQAYHLTHFYERGTVKPLEEQTAGFFGNVQLALSGVKLQKLVGAVPDSAYTNITLKTKDGLNLSGWLIKMRHAKVTVAFFNRQHLEPTIEKE